MGKVYCSEGTLDLGLSKLDNATFKTLKRNINLKCLYKAKIIKLVLFEIIVKITKKVNLQLFHISQISEIFLTIFM